uniref:Uncharacterized protein n=1 Tax=Glossina pallidipes TaxID=7398 RepID=A0A1A9Z466_GLOPL
MPSLLYAISHPTSIYLNCQKGKSIMLLKETSLCQSFARLSFKITCKKNHFLHGPVSSKERIAHGTSVLRLQRFQRDGGVKGRKFSALFNVNTIASPYYLMEFNQ